MTRQEEIIQKIKAKPAFAGKIFSPAFLRIIQTIDNAKSEYRFNIKRESGEASLERKLDRNDTFIMTDLGFFLIAVENSEFGRAKLNTYPNLTQFAVNAGFTPLDLLTFWNGDLSLKVGSTEFLESLDMQDAYRVNETQQTLATNFDEQWGLKDGLIPLTPAVIMKGDDNIDIRLNVPLFTGIEVANTNAGFVNHVVLKPKGYLIKEANT